MKTTINNQVLDFTKCINAKSSTISSIGDFITEQQQNLADSRISEILAMVSENSLAYKILMGKQSIFTDKQVWVVYFEIMKNAEAISKIENFYAEIAKAEIAKAEFRKSKKSEKSVLKTNAKKSVEKIANANAELAEGDKIEHATFGIGTIIRTNGDVLTIDFNGETKQMVAKFTKLIRL